MYCAMPEAGPVTVLIKTLADPTRRALFERLAGSGETTVSDLVRGVTGSQAAACHHRRALRAAGRGAERRDGRHVHYRAEPSGLAPLVDWIGAYSAFWRE